MSEDDRDGVDVVGQNSSGDELSFTSMPAWPDIPTEPAVMVNTILSQFSEDQFYVTFGQFLPPYFEGLSRDEVQQRFRTLPVQIVSRIAISPQRMLDIIRVLEENYDRWAARHGGPPREVQQ